MRLRQKGLEVPTKTLARRVLYDVPLKVSEEATNAMEMEEV